MENQDWTPQVIRKSYTKEEAKQKFGTTVKKTNTPNSQTQQGTPLHKIEADDFKPKIVSRNMGLQIEQGRLAKKWNQEQLAREAQLPVSIIKTYEKPNDSTVINHQYIQKISRVLGIQIKKD